uniref:Putative secreted protein n=1 Tax=Panstrongylus lignarius TaxID=156445 RepID=A0A224XRX6_9HEMI
MLILKIGRIFICLFELFALCVSSDLKISQWCIFITLVSVVCYEHKFFGCEIYIFFPQFIGLGPLSAIRPETRAKVYCLVKLHFFLFRM